MKKEFIPLELAVKLKKLGFDELCLFAFDNCSMPMRCTDLRTNEQKFNGVNYNSSSYTSQPTFSQAFRWFRDTHNLIHEIQIDRTSQPKFCYAILQYEHYGNYEEIRIREWCLYRTYEEAELACLENLIEVVESKS